MSERSNWTVSSEKQSQFCIDDINKSITSSVQVSNKLLDFVYFNERMDSYQERNFVEANPEIITLVEKYKK